MTTAYKRHLELIFPGHVAEGDVEIIQAATYDTPGIARLGPGVSATANGVGFRAYSASGSAGSATAFIGIICYGPPDPPYNFTYWLIEETQAEPVEAEATDGPQ